MENNEDFNQKEKMKEKTVRGGYNFVQLFITGFFLLGPFICGATINSIGNERPIRSHFAILHGFTEEANRPDLFPASLWTLGFLYPLGGFVGSFIGAYGVNKIGRRYSNLIFCISAIIGAIFKIISKYYSFVLLFIGRFFDGIAAAGFMIVSVILLLECLPEKIEKFYKPFISLFINCGILAMGIISMTSIAGENWNLIHLFTLLMALIMMIVTFFHPDTPSFIYTSQRDSTATRNILKKLRGKFYDDDEFLKLKNLVLKLSEVKEISIMDFFREKKFMLARITLIILHISQQLCGINYIIGFTPALLEKAGFSNTDAGGIIIFSIGVISSIMTSFIIPNQKRKILLILFYLIQLISFAAFIISDFANAPSGLAIFWLSLFVFSFNQGPGPITWFIALEMFPPQAVGTAQGVANSFNWLANTIVFLIVPISTEKIGTQIAFFFIAVNFLILTYITFFLIETKNKTSHKIILEYDRKLHPKLYTENELFVP